MGMYDYLNDEQIKFFYIPIIAMPNTFSAHSCIHYSGGQLKSFRRKKRVPYKTLWHNYGENFNIIDLCPEGYEYPIIHLIRCGRNCGITNFDKITDEMLLCQNYDDRGNKLNISSKYDLIKYRKAKNDYSDAFMKSSHNASREFLSFWRDHAKEIDSNTSLQEQWNILKEKSEQESTENNLLIKPYKDEIAKFVKEDDDTNEYEIFGALVYCLFNLGKKLTTTKDLQFCVVDDRLVYIVGYNQMMELLNSTDTFLDDYFNALSLDEKDIEKFKDMMKKIEEDYDIISKLEFTKDSFFPQYALKDIDEGRYKQFYKKYNICPYKGFDKW